MKNKKILLTADLHLTDKKRDEYRWSIFQILKEHIVKEKVNTLIILGDITDVKDKHASVLVNKVVRELYEVKEAGVEKIVILKGNHDYVEQTSPYFDFLSHTPNTLFITKPTIYDDNLFLPHTHTPTPEYFTSNNSCFNYVFLHQPFLGAKVNKMYELEKGMEVKSVWGEEMKGRLFSGDIHMPQTCGVVEYVGAPYPVHFGDEYKGRLILLEEGENTWKSIPVTSIRKSFITTPSTSDPLSFDVTQGDQVMLKIEIGKEDYLHVDEIKKRFKEGLEKKGAEICSIEVVKKREENQYTGETQEKDEIKNNKSKKEKVQEFWKEEGVSIEYLEGVSEEVELC